MKRFIVLDSTPLGLIVQRREVRLADECRDRIATHVAAGGLVIVPEIVHYELRRELLRLGKSASLAALEVFCAAQPDRLLPLDSKALRLAAELWADTRRQGAPTAHPHALDVDVILAAQVLSHGLLPKDFVVATSNVAHLARFVPAEHWTNI
jgi:predicted nucleic acid-binding protein